MSYSIRINLDIEVVKLLIVNGHSIDLSQILFTALHHKDIETLRFLLKYNVNINIKGILL